jgi:large subunit ribosomal protein L5
MAADKEAGSADAEKAAKAERAEKFKQKNKEKAEKKVRREAVQQMETPAGYVPKLQKRYETEIRPALMKELGLKNPMQAPRITKIVLNMGLGEATSNPNIVKTAVEEMSDLAGQRAVITKSKKAISNFKLRENQAIGCMVTLRKQRMWEFLERLVNVALPRVRDFKGVSGKAFDGRGNYTLGLKEQIIFPEVNYDAIDKVKGMNVTIITTAGDDVKGKALLKHIGMPFRA